TTNLHQTNRLSVRAHGPAGGGASRTGKIAAAFKGKQVSSGAVALTYAALGDKDESFRWLEKAYTERSSFMTSLKYWAVFDPLRSDTPLCRPRSPRGPSAMREPD